MIRELILIVLLFALSWAVSTYTPIPGALVVMALLFTFLQLKWVKLKHFPVIIPFLLVHIGFFFIPPAAKVVEAAAQLDGVIGKLLLTLIISNMLVMGVTGWVVQFVLKGDKNG